MSLQYVHEYVKSLPQYTQYYRTYYVLAGAVT